MSYKELNESTLLDIQSFVGMYPQIMERVYGLSLISQLADVQQTNYPALALYALVSRYDVEASKYPLSIVTFDKEGVIFPSQLTMGSDIVKVHYGEGHLYLVESNVKIPVGSILSDGTTTYTVTKTTSSRIGIGQIFKDFNNFKSDIDNISYEQSFSLIKSETFPYYRKIKSNFTRESLQDLMYMYNQDEEKVKATLINQVAQEIADETDKDFIDYINTIARKRPKLYFSRAVSSKQSMPDTITEIVTNINIAAAEVAAKTRRGMNIKIIVSPAVAGLILSSVQYAATSESENEDKNPRYVGNLGLSEIFVDQNADRDYFTVLYKGDKKGDAAIICSPYQLSVNWHTEYNSGKESLFYFLRESILRNPQDTGTGIDDCDFAITQDIDINFQNITNFTEPTPAPSGVQDFVEAFQDQLNP